MAAEPGSAELTLKKIQELGPVGVWFMQQLEADTLVRNGIPLRPSLADIAEYDNFYESVLKLHRIAADSTLTIEAVDNLPKSALFPIRNLYRLHLDEIKRFCNGLAEVKLLPPGVGGLGVVSAEDDNKNDSVTEWRLNVLDNWKLFVGVAHGAIEPDVATEAKKAKEAERMASSGEIVDMEFFRQQFGLSASTDVAADTLAEVDELIGEAVDLASKSTLTWQNMFQYQYHLEGNPVPEAMLTSLRALVRYEQNLISRYNDLLKKRIDGKTWIEKRNLELKEMLTTTGDDFAVIGSLLRQWSIIAAKAKGKPAPRKTQDLKEIEDAIEMEETIHIVNELSKHDESFFAQQFGLIADFKPTRELYKHILAAITIANESVLNKEHLSEIVHGMDDWNGQLSIADTAAGIVDLAAEFKLIREYNEQLRAVVVGETWIDEGLTQVPQSPESDELNAIRAQILVLHKWCEVVEKAKQWEYTSDVVENNEGFRAIVDTSRNKKPNDGRQSVSPSAGPSSSPVPKTESSPPPRVGIAAVNAYNPLTGEIDLATATAEQLHEVILTTWPQYSVMLGVVQTQRHYLNTPDFLKVSNALPRLEDVEQRIKFYRYTALLLTTLPRTVSQEEAAFYRRDLSLQEIFACLEQSWDDLWAFNTFFIVLTGEKHGIFQNRVMHDFTGKPVLRLVEANRRGALTLLRSWASLCHHVWKYEATFEPNDPEEDPMNYEQNRFESVVRNWSAVREFARLTDDEMNLSVDLAVRPRSTQEPPNLGWYRVDKHKYDLALEVARAAQRGFILKEDLPPDNNAPKIFNLLFRDWKAIQAYDDVILKTPREDDGFNGGIMEGIRVRAGIAFDRVRRQVPSRPIVDFIHRWAEIGELAELMSDDVTPIPESPLTVNQVYRGLSELWSKIAPLNVGAANNDNSTRTWSQIHSRPTKQAVASDLIRYTKLLAAWKQAAEKAPRDPAQETFDFGVLSDVLPNFSSERDLLAVPGTSVPSPFRDLTPKSRALVFQQSSPVITSWWRAYGIWHFGTGPNTQNAIKDVFAGIDPGIIAEDPEHPPWKTLYKPREVANYDIQNSVFAPKSEKWDSPFKPYRSIWRDDNGRAMFADIFEGYVNVLQAMTTGHCREWVPNMAFQASIPLVGAPNFYLTIRRIPNAKTKRQPRVPDSVIPGKSTVKYEVVEAEDLGAIPTFVAQPSAAETGPSPWGAQTKKESEDGNDESEPVHSESALDAANLYRYFITNDDPLRRVITVNGLVVPFGGVAGPLPEFAIIEIEKHVVFWFGVGNGLVDGIEADSPYGSENPASYILRKNGPQSVSSGSISSAGKGSFSPTGLRPFVSPEPDPVSSPGLDPKDEPPSTPSSNRSNLSGDAVKEEEQKMEEDDDHPGEQTGKAGGPFTPWWGEYPAADDFQTPDEEASTGRTGFWRGAFRLPELPTWFRSSYSDPPKRPASGPPDNQSQRDPKRPRVNDSSDTESTTGGTVAVVDNTIPENYLIQASRTPRPRPGRGRTSQPYQPSRLSQTTQRSPPSSAQPVQPTQTAQDDNKLTVGIVGVPSEPTWTQTPAYDFPFIDPVTGISFPAITTTPATTSNGQVEEQQSYSGGAEDQTGGEPHYTVQDAIDHHAKLTQEYEEKLRLHQLKVESKTTARAKAVEQTRRPRPPQTLLQIKANFKVATKDEIIQLLHEALLRKYRAKFRRWKKAYDALPEGPKKAFLGGKKPGPPPTKEDAQQEYENRLELGLDVYEQLSPISPMKSPVIPKLKNKPFRVGGWQHPGPTGLSESDASLANSSSEDESGVIPLGGTDPNIRDAFQDSKKPSWFRRVGSKVKDILLPTPWPEDSPNTLSEPGALRPRRSGTRRRGSREYTSRPNQVVQHSPEFKKPLLPPKKPLSPRARSQLENAAITSHATASKPHPPTPTTFYTQENHFTPSYHLPSPQLPKSNTWPAHNNYYNNNSNSNQRKDPFAPFHDPPKAPERLPGEDWKNFDQRVRIWEADIIEWEEEEMRLANGGMGVIVTEENEGLWFGDSGRARGEMVGGLIL